MGIVVTGGEGADTSVVHTGTGGDVGGQFLDGLLGNEPRKTGWMRAEAAGDAGPWRQQAILGRGRWDAEALRDIVRDYALETLGDGEAVLVIDETGFLKQGKGSCGVARQYTGSAGKITNCQIGVFATYVSRHGHAFIDRALYLPKEWTDDRKRLKAAHVPDGVGFATKPQIARKMIARAIGAKLPFAFVAADSGVRYGRHRDHASQSGQGLCSGRGRQSCVQLLGQEAVVVVPLPRSRKIFPRALGGACRRAKEPKARDCMIGPISNWLIWMPANTATPSRGNGHEAC